MSTILITGAAGFIGSHVSEALLRQGHTVVGVDNLNDFYPEAIKRRNVAEVRAAVPGTPFILCEGDLRDLPWLEGVFAAHAPTAVIHLAAYAGVRPSIEQPLLYTQVNIDGTMNVLECMRKQGTARLCFASSSSVYGNNPVVPFSEQQAVDRPISPYAATKKAGEVLCYAHHHLFGLRVACLRFFTVYGPRQRPDLAIHKFTRLIEAGEPVPFFGDGSMRRDHTYIADIVDGVLRALAWTDSDAPRYDIFNLGESRTISLTELVEAIAQALGKQPVLQRLPAQPGDVQQTYADITHAREVLGYHPSTELADGLAQFVRWYRAVNP